MKPKTLLYLMGFVILLVIAGIALLVIDSANSSPVRVSNGIAAIATPIPTVNATATAAVRGSPAPFPTEFFNNSRTQSPMVGAPAIQPHIKAANASTPTFTEQDVRDYIAVHPDGPNRKAEVLPTIDKIEFITYQDLKNQQGSVLSDLSLEDNRLICYLELSGRFVIYGPPTAGKENKIVYNKVIIVFDAQTGNLLQG